MESPKHDLIGALRQLVSALERLSDVDLAKLMNDSYNVEIRFTRKRNKEEIPEIPEADLSALVSKLTAFTSRQEAQGYLDTNYGTKKTLELIARHLDIPIMKQDKIEVLRDKIIEATVGARIRSQAIQGSGL